MHEDHPRTIVPAPPAANGRKHNFEWKEGIFTTLFSLRSSLTALV